MKRATNYMKRALAIARQALGNTSPNPAVGAVVVKDGVVVGEGYTQPPGQPHAEIVALQQAGGASRGASLYVTLEPCCVYGRTPPCTQAIIAAGIIHVHVATKDPNPVVDGRGIGQLQAAGIRVHRRQGKWEARELYEAFAKHITTGLPFVTAKFAMSLDGKIATRTGDSRWVTGEPARGRVQQIRRTSDAIMVGVNTVLRDDPQLTVRGVDGEAVGYQPLRVILDSKGRTPPQARLLREPGQTLIAVTRPPDTMAAALARAGAEVLHLPETEEGMVDPYALTQTLGARNVVSLLVEGGGTLLGSLFDLGLVDKVVAFIAPTVIGGLSAPSPVAGKGSADMSRALKLNRVRVERIGEDILVVGYPPARPFAPKNTHSSTTDLLARR